MFSALLVGAALLGQPAEASVVERLERFCLATEMRKQDFEQAAGDQGLERLIRVVRSLDDVDPIEWESMFRDRSSRTIQVAMSGASTDPEVATYCAVMVPEPLADWRASLEHLASSMGLRPGEEDASGDVREAGKWVPKDRSGSSLVYKLYSSALVVSLERTDEGQP